MKLVRLAVSLLLCATGSILFAQAKPAIVTAKPSPASDALNAAAKEHITEQKAYDAALQEARATLDSTSKDLQKQLVDLNKSLNEQVRADKKYKPLIDKIDAIDKQLQSAQQDVQKKFSDRVGPISRALNTDGAMVSGLIPVVRKENGWPDTAAYDESTQTWTGTGSSSSSAETHGDHSPIVNGDNNKVQ